MDNNMLNVQPQDMNNKNKNKFKIFFIIGICIIIILTFILIFINLNKNKTDNNQNDIPVVEGNNNNSNKTDKVNTDDFNDNNTDNNVDDNNSIEYSLNQTVTIAEENIKLTLLNTKKTKIDGIDYLVIKTKIENYGDKEYSWSINFKIGEDFNQIAEPYNILPSKVNPGEIVEGNLYFTNISAKKLSYFTRPIIKAYDTETEEYVFERIEYIFKFD